MKKIRSRWIAWTAVFVLLGLAIRTDMAYGADAIDTDRGDCSITFDLSRNYQKPGGQELPDLPYEEADGYAELKSLQIPVDIYKVADVDSTGKYKAPAVNTALYEVLEAELDKAGSGTTAAEWMTMAESAAKKVGEEASLEKSSILLNGPDPNNTAAGLSTGLYLVMAHQVESAEYVYIFDPYLVSLPGNNYNPAEENSSDEWIYDVTVGLKASRENRYGDLEIVKTLESYNATLGGASFIFQIEAQKDGITFSDVRSLVFDNAGTRSLKVEGKIPAGAEVAVREVYSGGSYKVTSAPEQTAIVVADQSVSVSFTNDHDGRLVGGTSVVNHFFVKERNGRMAGGTAIDDPYNTDSGKTNGIIWDAEKLADSTGQTGGSSNEEKVE